MYLARERAPSLVCFAVDLWEPPHRTSRKPFVLCLALLLQWMDAANPNAFETTLSRGRFTADSQQRWNRVHVPFATVHGIFAKFLISMHIVCYANRSQIYCSARLARALQQYPVKIQIAHPFPDQFPTTCCTARNLLRIKLTYSNIKTLVASLAWSVLPLVRKQRRPPN